MTRKAAAPPQKTIDFGAPDQPGAYLFRVEIPAAAQGQVRIVEHYGYHGGDSGIPQEEERVVLNRSVWTAIAETARKDFNARLKEKKLATGRWKAPQTLGDRMLGKELCVLAWAAETATAAELPVICSKWAALRPEERWWLFAMTVAEAGLPEDSQRGWRRALYYALADGDPGSPRRRRRPDEETDFTVLPLFRG